MNWLNETIGNKLIYHVIIAVVIVLVFYFLSRLVRGFLFWIGRRVFAKTENTLDDTKASA